MKIGDTFHVAQPIQERIVQETLDEKEITREQENDLKQSKQISSVVDPHFYDLDIDVEEKHDPIAHCSQSTTCASCSCTCSCATCGRSCPWC